MDTILIVEDNDLEIKLFKSFLANIGYNILIATNGQDTYALLEEYHPSLILMDLRLPGGISGWDIAHTIKSHYQLSEIPIILMTAYDFPDDRRRAQELGCADFICKPINMKSLKQQVQAFLEGKTQV